MLFLSILGGVLELKKTIAIMGAGGKMGMRISRNLEKDGSFNVFHIENGEAGQKRLKEAGFSIDDQDSSLASSDIVILAVPDKLIGKISSEIVPKLNEGTMVIGLDPAAAYSEVLCVREGLSYFVAHPTHPSLFNDETDPAAQHDYFGGIAKQSVVCALYHGPEEQYAVGEKIARIIYAPVLRTHRVTVEQMAILEPALVETFGSVLIEAIRQGFDKVVEMGVPKEAAWDFLMGHCRVQFAVLFDLADFKFSDGAYLAMDKARSKILQPDWKEKIFNLESIKHSVQEITDSVRI